MITPAFTSGGMTLRRPSLWIDASEKDEKVVASHLCSKYPRANMPIITELCIFTEHKKRQEIHACVHYMGIQSNPVRLMQARLPLISSAEFTKNQSRQLLLFLQKFYTGHICSPASSLKGDIPCVTHISPQHLTQYLYSSQEKLDKYLLNRGILVQTNAMIFLTSPTSWWPPPLCMTLVRIRFPRVLCMLSPILKCLCRNAWKALVPRNPWVAWACLTMGAQPNPIEGCSRA